FTQELCRNSPEMIIVIDEIGCGIVPVEKSERVWRENVGRCGCIIAENSELVIRVVCGIPTVIKGDAR
ncbi:MAG: bifunctional adenosylcobinamide kinase/adenosylcobinamide-phosphate guanylyltransferase, partial [Ruminococcus sp.]|nr:bifunctional adenosylcobinamide kinase/adenosylcobinamide-phosphate guanylyltransferase [Ruminococcus sp.]